MGRKNRGSGFQMNSNLDLRFLRQHVSDSSAGRKGGLFLLNSSFQQANNGCGGGGGRGTRPSTLSEQKREKDFSGHLSQETVLLGTRDHPVVLSSYIQLSASSVKSHRHGCKIYMRAFGTIFPFLEASFNSSCLPVVSWESSGETEF